MGQSKHRGLTVSGENPLLWKGILNFLIPYGAPGVVSSVRWLRSLLDHLW
jgi:hypothetical protein